MSKIKEPIRVVFYDDGFDSTTGYGRVARELTTRLARDPKYEVYNLNITDKNPMKVVDNVTVLPIFGQRYNPLKTGYIASMVNTISMIRPHVIIPICDAFLLDRDGLNKIEYGSSIKVMPYVPIDSNGIAFGSIPTFEKAHRILVQSEFGQKEIEKVGFNSHVFRHGVDQEKFQPNNERRKIVRARLGITDEKVFLFIGRNTPRKRIKRLIRGFAIFIKNNPDKKVKLILHGSDYDNVADNIFKQIEIEEDLYDVDISDKIIFPYQNHTLGQGEVEEKIIDLYHACDWTVSMSSGEGTGLTSLESFACGKPVIYPENSNYEEILGKPIIIQNESVRERGISVKSVEDIFVGIGCTQPLSSYEDFAIQLANAYNLPDHQYDVLSGNALAWIKENANWDIITQELKLHIRKVRNNE